MRPAKLVEIWKVRYASLSPDQFTKYIVAADYGHFAVGSSTAWADWGPFGGNQLTPSFFCRLEDEVVYWNTSRLSG